MDYYSIIHRTKQCRIEYQNLHNELVHNNGVTNCIRLRCYRNYKVNLMESEAQRGTIEVSHMLKKSKIDYYTLFIINNRTVHLTSLTDPSNVSGSDIQFNFHSYLSSASLFRKLFQN